MLLTNISHLAFLVDISALSTKTTICQAAATPAFEATAPKPSTATPSFQFGAAPAESGDSMDVSSQSPGNSVSVKNPQQPTMQTDRPSTSHRMRKAVSTSISYQTSLPPQKNPAIPNSLIINEIMIIMNIRQ